MESFVTVAVLLLVVLLCCSDDLFCKALAIRKYLSWRHLQVQKVEVLKRLFHLSAHEMTLLSYCLFRNRQTFFHDCYDPTCNGLVHKLLLFRAEGPMRVDAWAFTIPGPVWEFMMSKKDEFLPEKLTRDPAFLNEMDSMDQWQINVGRLERF